MTIRPTLGFLIVVLAAAASPAQTPLGTAFTYQGQLKNAGSPANGVHDLRFRLYDASTVGAQVGATLCMDNVIITDGLFTAPLDFGAQFVGQQRFLEIDVRADTGLNCANSAGFTVLTPRQALTASPNALFALDADRIDGLTSTDFLRSTLPLSLSAPSDTHILLAQNTTNSSGVFAIRGEATGGLSLGGIGVYGLSAGPLGTGVYGIAPNISPAGGFGVQGHAAGPNGRGVFGNATAATGATSGVYGQSVSTSGRGVFGLANATTGFTYGGYFESASRNGLAVYAINTGAGRAGYFESANDTTSDGYGYTLFAHNNAAAGSSFGMYGQTESTNGRGVVGLANASTGTTYGVYGATYSPSGYGVFGHGSVTSGNAYGVYGLSESPSGRGVFGRADATSGTTYGVYGESTSTTGRGVFGSATAAGGNTYGVQGESASTSGRGVFGLASAATGAASGVYGDSVSTTGIGVRGRAQATTGANFGGFFATNSTSGVGVYGDVNATTGTNYGVFGESASASGRGVNGYASAASGDTYGVAGFTDSNDISRAVYGEATATNGPTRGGEFISHSSAGYGVRAYADASSGTTYGVYGFSVSPTGTGVFGLSTNGGGVGYGVFGESQSASGRGVYGLARTSANSYGVLGRNDTGYAVYATGNSGASGSKSFRIDHPDDPENKYLLHYAAESPEVINFYSETVTLDERGEAVVELPHYFAKINTRPRYQLTAVGAPMPMLHIAEKMSETALSVGAKAGPGESAPICSFRVAGGAPGSDVSWEVKAVRNDRWVQKRGAPVEVEKSASEKGTYQHPELYGQPPEKGMNYDANHERHEPARDEPVAAAAADATMR